MQVQVLNNRGSNNLGGLFYDELTSGVAINWASAFITGSGMELLKYYIKVNKKAKRHSRMLIGLYHCFNSKAILLELQDLAQENGFLQIHVSTNKRFHWKYYHFNRVERNIFYIGSSNLTGEGLEGLGEVTTRISYSKAEKSNAVTLIEVFNKEWTDSIDIAKISFRNYRQQPLENKGLKLPKEIEQALKISEERQSYTHIRLKRATLICGHLAQKTVKILSKAKSHWNKNHWDYYSCYNKAEFLKDCSSPYLLVIERYERQYTFSLVEKMDDCSNVSTPDGKYFVAYKKIARKLKENNKLRGVLEKIKVKYYSRGFMSKSIGRKQAKSISELFKMQD